MTLRDPGWLRRPSSRRWLRWGLAAVLAAAAIVAGLRGVETLQDRWFQQGLSAFYAVEPPTSAQPGELLRSEPLPLTVPGGRAQRILYATEDPFGEVVTSGGLVFLPDASAPVPPGGRPVVAWAHPTLGLADSCAPSRSRTRPLVDTDGWLEDMLRRGWIVTASDYAGVGTPGTPFYLVGESEVADVVNSVRAARALVGAEASSRYAVWGHSQGGHAALYTAMFGGEYAPELTLVGAAAASPPTELPALFALQWRDPVAWFIGPDAAASWPELYPNLTIEGLVSAAGSAEGPAWASECVMDKLGKAAMLRASGSRYFDSDPMRQRGWFDAATEQSVYPEEFRAPVYLAQGLADEIVLPTTQALFVERACQAGRSFEIAWLGVGHLNAARESGPGAVQWIADRFAGRPAQTNSCTVPLPVEPAAEPHEP